VSEDALPPLRDVIARHGLAAKKSLGQNFLFDLNLTRRIARAAAPLKGFTVIEVGPGPGGLTRALLMEGASRLVAIERDERAIAALEEISAAFFGRLKIISSDALELDHTSLADGPVKIVANLPYNIATQLLIGWLSEKAWPPFFASLTLMFQKEVAERIVASPGGKEYGRLSVLSQYRCEARKLFDVNRSAFTPPPKVTSSIVQLTPRPKPEPSCDLAMLEKVTAAAFGQRRKMLRASLKSLLPEPEPLLSAAGIDPQLRAEQVPVDGFARLARAYETLASRRMAETTVLSDASSR
jgi:16S rRNA (adenine1518-N6/adenine1519-N6)-dimethyltransferase